MVGGKKKKGRVISNSNSEYGITSHRDVENRIEYSRGSAGPSSSAVTDCGIAGSSGVTNPYTSVLQEFFDKNNLKKFRRFNKLCTQVIVDNSLETQFLSYFNQYFKSSVFSEVNKIISDEHIELLIIHSRPHQIIEKQLEIVRKEGMIFFVTLLSIGKKVGFQRLEEVFSFLPSNINEKEKLYAYNGTPKKIYEKERFRLPESQIRAAERDSRFTNRKVLKYREGTVTRFAQRAAFKYDSQIVDDDYINAYHVKKIFDILEGKNRSSCCGSEFSVPDKRKKPLCNTPVKLFTARGQSNRGRILTDAFLWTGAAATLYFLGSTAIGCAYFAVVDVPSHDDPSTMLKCSDNKTLSSNFLMYTGISFVVFTFILISRSISKGLIKSSNRKIIRNLKSAIEDIVSEFFEKKDSSPKDAGHEAEQAEEGRLLPSTSIGVSGAADNSALKNVVVVNVESEIGAAHAV